MEDKNIMVYYSVDLLEKIKVATNSICEFGQYFYSIY